MGRFWSDSPGINDDFEFLGIKADHFRSSRDDLSNLFSLLNDLYFSESDYGDLHLYNRIGILLAMDDLASEVLLGWSDSLSISVPFHPTALLFLLHAPPPCHVDLFPRLSRRFLVHYGRSCCSGGRLLAIDALRAETVAIDGHGRRLDPGIGGEFDVKK